jgi:hypothetical protein
MITDLTPLMSLDSVDGLIRIYNTALVTLDGLQNLRDFDNLYIYDNALLEDASAISGNCFTWDVSLYNNPVLRKIPNPKNWERVDYYYIGNNPMLDSVEVEFNTITQNKIELPSFEISNCNNLKYLKVISNGSIYRVRVEDCNKIKRCDFEVEADYMHAANIYRNAKLEKINGLQDLDTLATSRVIGNPSLDNLCVLQKFISNQTLLLAILDSNAQGCNSKAEISATDCSDFNTGIAAILEPTLSVFPNPSTGMVTVSGLSAKAFVTVYALSGQQVLHTQLQHNQISLGHLPKGVYMLKSQNEVVNIILE